VVSAINGQSSHIQVSLNWIPRYGTLENNVALQLLLSK